jgi:hypothetical protein
MLMPSQTVSDLKRADSVLSRITAHTTPMGQRAKERAKNTVRYGHTSKPRQLKKKTRRRRKSHINRKHRLTRADMKREMKQMTYIRSFIGKHHGRRH